RQRRLRRLLGMVRQPLVAIPLFVVTLYGWRFSFAFEAAMGHPALRAVQHLLIADLAAPPLLADMRTPVLQFFLPRPVLVPLARQRRLRRLLGRVRQPLVAIPLFVVTLYGWHFSFAFEAAMGNAALHALQHFCFVGGAILVWWPVIEPDRARMRGELWKMGHVLAARFIGMFVGMAFVITRAPVYTGVYGDRAREHGLSPLADQQLAGGLMLSLELLVIVLAMSFFFWRAGVEHDRSERETAAGAVTSR
ncbi:MAG: cytochrome c oxidase assembly protein, partial [Solirubrobacteraceae bacterium]